MNLSNIIKNKTIKLFLIPPPAHEIKIVKINLNLKPKMGLNKNTTLFIGPKKVRALENSFTASAAG